MAPFVIGSLIVIFRNGGFALMGQGYSGCCQHGKYLSVRAFFVISAC